MCVCVCVLSRLKQRYGGWSGLHYRGTAVGSEATGGRGLGADVDRLLSRRRGVSLGSREARCEMSFGVLALGKDASKLALPACGRGHASGHAGSATLRAGPRARGPRRTSMARRSTGDCSACSRHSVQPRQGVWEGLQGQRGPSRARWRAEYSHDHEFSTRGAGGGLARRAARRQAAVQPLNSVFYIAPLAATACGGRRGRLASPALPPTSTRASARRPRRLRWARGARLSSGACSAGCAAQSLTHSERRWCGVGPPAALLPRTLRCGRHHRVLAASPMPLAALAAALPFPAIAQTN